MAFFKTDAEREQERLAAEARRTAEQERRIADQQARAAEEFATSPVGRAAAAHASGQRYFEIQLDVARNEGTAGWGLASTNDTRSEEHPGVLGAIEEQGWTLQNVGYVYQVLAQSSTDKFLVTGQETAVTGRTVGIYLFRRTD